MDPKKLYYYYRRFRGYPRFASAKYARASALMWAAPTTDALVKHSIRYKRYWRHA